MNKAQASAINADVKAALAEVFAKHGLEMGKQNLSFTASGEITLNVKAATKEAKQSNVKMFAIFVNVKEEDIERVFTLGGKELKLADYNARARKMPWVAEEPSTGKRYKLTDEQVQRAFAQFA
jgi:ABC-type antimicrobial peptide transport system ATPase subunit